MKTHHINIIFLLLLSTTLNAQFQTVQWARAGLSWGYDKGYLVCSDKYNNIYCAGEFGYNYQQSPAPYIIFNNDTVFNNGSNQIFLIKYSANGDVLWAKGIGGNNFVSPFGGLTEQPGVLYYDSISNAIYFSGLFDGTVSFGNTIITGTQDAFVSKIDLDGNYLWVKTFLSPTAISCRYFTVDLNGIFYITGSSQDSITIENTQIPPGKFLVKLNSSGQIIDAQSKFSYKFIITGISFFNESLLISGYTFENTALIDTITFSSNFTNTSLLLKYSSSLQLQQMIIVAQSNNGKVSQFSTDSNGDLIFSGSFRPNLIIDSLTFQSSSGLTEAFFAKISNSGNLIWAKQITSTLGVGPEDLQIDLEDNLLITGNCSGLTDFNGSTIEGKGLFTVGYTKDGDCLGTAFVENTYGKSITCDNYKNVYITGSYQNTPTIGDTTLTDAGLAPNVLVVKFDAFTGIEEKYPNSNDKLFIYANPTTGLCNIEIPEEFEHEPQLTLFVYDQTGRLLKQAEIVMEEERVKLNLEALAKGMYTAIISNGKKKYSGKIIFQ
jgi:hypothetical protein